MRRRAIAAILAASTVAACAEVAPIDPALAPGALGQGIPVALALAGPDMGLDRAVEASTLERPFANGAMAVMARDGREVETWRLVPCRGGAAICAGGLEGPAGTLSRTPDWHVVRGLGGATFWLDEGGFGVLERGGRFAPLAWNALGDGTGFGADADLETAAPHCADLACTDIPRPY